MLLFAGGNRPTPCPDSPQDDQNIKIRAEDGTLQTQSPPHVWTLSYEWARLILYKSISCFLGKCYCICLSSIDDLTFLNSFCQFKTGTGNSKSLIIRTELNLNHWNGDLIEDFSLFPKTTGSIRSHRNSGVTQGLSFCHFLWKDEVSWQDVAHTPSFRELLGRPNSGGFDWVTRRLVTKPTSWQVLVCHRCVFILCCAAGWM